MSEENVLAIIIQAVSDPEFRELLFNDPDKALDGFELTVEEADLLHKMEREHFDDAFGELDERVSRAGFSSALSFSEKLSTASKSADSMMSAGQLAAPYLPGGSVLGAAISGLGQLKNSLGG